MHALQEGEGGQRPAQVGVGSGVAVGGLDHLVLRPPHDEEGRVGAAPPLPAQVVQGRAQRRRLGDGDVGPEVIEVSERFPLRDLPLLATHVALWRNEGFCVAIDDFSAGYAGLATLAAIRPDVVKLDRSLVSGVMRDRWQRELVSAMVAAVEPLGVTVIAEGIGHAEDLPALVAMGVRFGQGFVLGRPQARPASAPFPRP
ncbi:MAG: EAL domain-containing protein [Firmicutes bacterium]|nr:EAL domain-containing protein [Bacillota bacterium]